MTKNRSEFSHGHLSGLAEQKPFNVQSVELIILIFIISIQKRKFAIHVWVNHRKHILYAKVVANPFIMISEHCLHMRGLLKQKIFICQRTAPIVVPTNENAYVAGNWSLLIVLTKKVCVLTARNKRGNGLQKGISVNVGGKLY